MLLREAFATTSSLVAVIGASWRQQRTVEGLTNTCWPLAGHAHAPRVGRGSGVCYVTRFTPATIQFVCEVRSMHDDARMSSPNVLAGW